MSKEREDVGLRILRGADTPEQHLEDAVHAMWHDPTTYDPFRHGPPYLPGMGSYGARTARTKTADHMDLNKVCAEMCAEYGEGCHGELSVLLVWLRAASFVHQTHHWQTRGVAYYADHLLFDRLYNESQGMIDSIAERAVGSQPDMGHMCVRPLLQSSQMMRVVWFFYPTDDTFTTPETYPAISLGMEQHLLQVLNILRGRMDTDNRLSTGTDNLLQGVADTHEGFVYLLQQRTNTHTADAMLHTASDYDYSR